MKRRLRIVGLAMFAAVGSTGALAQSFNIDFGMPGTSPSSSYGAAGFSGYWNQLWQPPGEHSPLLDINGTASAVDCYQIGFSTMLNSNDPLTMGDDEALVDDMYLSPCSPTDGCFWIDHLANGNYEVLIYAIRPSNPMLSQTRVDFGTPGPTWVGGLWPGGHQQGVTYSRFTIAISNGRIALHSGIPSSGQVAGMNGLQITYLDGQPLAVYPNAVQVVAGAPFGGNLASLHFSDDDRFAVLGDEFDPNGIVVFDAVSPRLLTSLLQFVVESRTTRPDIVQFVDMWNQPLGVWESVSIQSMTTVDQSSTVSVSSQPSRFIHSQTGQLRARLRAIPTSDMFVADGWGYYFDQAIWKIKP